MASPISPVSGISAALFATFFPSECHVCGAPLINISRLPVCGECLADVRPAGEGVCSLCGQRLLSPHAFARQDGEPVCGLCRRLIPPFEKAAAYGSDDGGLRELIHLLKDELVRPAANVLGRMLAEVVAGFATGMAGDSVLVVPVPLHAKTLRQRGFNQSELIARTALKLLSDDRFVLRADLLQRKRETRSQTGLSGPERRDNIRGAFAVTNAQDLGGSVVLLVDDVLTTGTTASECARILRRAGAARVWVAIVARTLKLDVARAERLEEDDARLAMAAHG